MLILEKFYDVNDVVGRRIESKPVSLIKQN